jgi:TPP-dependent indolepyruvate ferredoxin oxidoreductase alpha subunit
MSDAMQNAAKRWRNKIEDDYKNKRITTEEYAKIKSRWDRADKIKQEVGSTKAYREHIAQSRINNFVNKYKTAEEAVAFFNNPVNRKATPIGRNAKIIFLRVAYNTPKEIAERYFPKYMKVARPVKFTYPIEEAEMFNIPKYEKKVTLVEEKPPQQTTTPTGESTVLTEVKKPQT